MACLQAKQTSIHGFQRVMVFHFSGEKGLSTQGQRSGPFITASAGADRYPGDALALAHGSHHRIQRVGCMGCQGLDSHGSGQVANAEITLSGDVCQAQALGQYVIDAAGSAVQVGVSAQHVKVMLRQLQNHPRFIAGGQHLLDRGKHDRVMGNDQIGTNDDGFLNNRRGQIQGNKNAADLRRRVAHQHTGIITGHLGVIGGQGVNEIMNILHG